MGGRANADGAFLSPGHAQAVTEPLPPRKRAKTPVGEDTSQSLSEEAEGKADDASSDSSSALSVDTGVDSDGGGLASKRRGVAALGALDGGCLKRRALEKTDVAEEDDVDLDEEQPEKVDDAEDILAFEGRARRHPPGTWKVWECQWFYATQTPGWIDVKMWMKNHLRREVSGMGSVMMSRTLRPHHFGDELAAPQRTIVLLRAWAIWRAKWRGWARQEDSRQRELQRMLADLERDIRLYSAAGTGALVSPLLDSVAAEQKLKEWVPQLVHTLTATA